MLVFSALPLSYIDARADGEIRTRVSRFKDEVTSIDTSALEPSGGVEPPFPVCDTGALPLS